MLGSQTNSAPKVEKVTKWKQADTKLFAGGSGGVGVKPGDQWLVVAFACRRDATSGGGPEEGCNIRSVSTAEPLHFDGSQG